MLYLLKRLDRVSWDENRALVVRADNAYQARLLAAESAADEPRETWLDVQRSSCEVVMSHGEAEIVLVDFKAG